MVKRTIFQIIICLFLFTGPELIQAKSRIVVMRIDGSINPVSADFLISGIKKFNNKNFQGILIRINTPGGLLSSTRKIIRAMLGSQVPVMVLVAPNGARAASAGFFILMAADKTLMYSQTHTGSASPVSLFSSKKKKAKKSTMDKKVWQDTLAYIRTLAKRKKRPLKPVVEAVKNAISYTAEEAIKLKIIDAVVYNQKHLNTTISSFSGVLKNGKKFQYREVEWHEYHMPWHKKILLALSQPNLVYILLMLGFYGMIFEFFTPGFGIPGVLGGIFLVLGLSGLSVLPFNAAGLFLVLLGLVLLILELNIVSYGLLSIGGLVCIALGSFMFFDEYPGSFSWLRGAIIAFILFVSVLVSFALTKLIRLQKKESSFFHETGKTARVFEEFKNGKGLVLFEGEYWKAVCHQSDILLKKGDTVIVNRADGMVLDVKVKPKEKQT